MLKKILLGLVAVLLLGAASGGVYVQLKVSAYDESVGKKYDFPLEPVTSFKNMSELELKALWMFLRSLPPTPVGQR